MTESTDDTPIKRTPAEHKEHWRALLVDDADCCELLARLKEEYDLQHAEIERLRTRILDLPNLLEENRRLRARILELEAELAITHGSLAQPTPDEAATIVHDVPPNAPR
jgi:hypothetical protein